MYEGQVKRNQEALSLFSSDVDLQQAMEKWMANGKLSKLGGAVGAKGWSWIGAKLCTERTKPQRLSLPTYPFARERYWIRNNRWPGGAAGSREAGSGVALLHPLASPQYVVSEPAELPVQPASRGTNSFS